MRDRNDMITHITEALGTECSNELAERVYEELRADDRIYFNDLQGLVLRDDVDLLEVAESILARNV